MNRIEELKAKAQARRAATAHVTDELTEIRKALNVLRIELDTVNGTSNEPISTLQARRYSLQNRAAQLTSQLKAA